MISFDYLLQKVGDAGLCQILVGSLLGYSSAIVGYHALVTVFIAYQSDYRCNVPPLDNATAYPNLTEADILNYTTPFDKLTEEYDTCSKFGYNYSKCDGTLSCVNRSANGIPCDQGYWYDRSLFTETVITEYNLVCDRSYLLPLSTSTFYIGMLIGSLFFGNVADRYGRKPTMVAPAVLGAACMFGLSYSTSVEMYMAFRVLIACFLYGGTIGTFVYLMEIIGARWRTLFGMVYHIYHPVGIMIISGLAYKWRNWHQLMLVISLFCTPFIVFVAILPESPRWLFAMERDEEGIKVTNLMARINRRPLTENDWAEARKAGEEKMRELLQRESASKYSIFDLFKTVGLRILTLKVMFCWFVNSLVYYGISLNAGSLAGDIFVNNTLNGAFEAASYVACILLMDRIGRRILLSAMFLIAGVGLLASVIVDQYAGDNHSLQALGTAFAFFAKFGIAGAFAITYNYTTELYPTVVRSNGIGNGSVASRVGGIVAPYVISIQDSISWLPNSVFGVFAVLAGVLSLTFPETNGKPMMETIEQAEIFYKTGEVVDLNRLRDDHGCSVNDESSDATATECENGAFAEDETSQNAPLLPSHNQLR